MCAAATVAGCTQSQAGQAAPATTTEPSSAPTTGQSSGSAAPTIPPRPRELKLDDVDPCALFTKPQLAQLKVDRTRQRTSNAEQYRGMRECVLMVEKQSPVYDYGALAVTNEGIAPWLSGNRNVEAKLTSVAGFAAATYWFRGAQGTNAADCAVSVDVAEGQQLVIDTNNDGAHSFTLEQMCQRVEQAAGLAVQTLQTLK
ncbi:MAG TPA: DUF3558 domain-containing protein [Actinophytocola sp.]|uniref:DUF3558 domain-containing protein n=1 Tax=Actinophytocola sp. TaxID=1872138 RepID=UPI002E04CEAD|nr:DUF3558 domain-containing protein [Actinophytocola sp.]